MDAKAVAGVATDVSPQLTAILAKLEQLEVAVVRSEGAAPTPCVGMRTPTWLASARRNSAVRGLTCAARPFYHFRLLRCILALVIVTLVFMALDDADFNGMRSKQGDVFDRFRTRFYFVITTLSSVGYGDMSPKTDRARAYCVAVMLLIFIL